MNYAHHSLLSFGALILMVKWLKKYLLYTIEETVVWVDMGASVKLETMGTEDKNTLV